MPPPAKEVKHHPASVNDLLLRQLLERTPDTAVLKGLTAHLSALSTAVAGKVLEAAGVDPDQTGGSLSANEIHAIVRTLQRTKLHAPDGSCLSPAGEYNLTLGILKELAPDFVATHTEPAGAYDGHPFIVEAGIALGGTKAQEGITVHRYANRIPLLFEAGADVVTRTAMKRIRWSNYKIDQKKDKITVFVSLVSTKIPFKGTGKEYIGDDITEIADVVKKALMSCGAQLRSKLNIRASHRERDQKRKALLKKAEDFFSPTALEAALRLTVDSMQSEAVDERDEAQKAATRCILASGIFDDPQAKRIKAPNGLYIMAVFQE